MKSIERIIVAVERFFENSYMLYVYERYEGIKNKEKSESELYKKVEDSLMT